MTPGETVVVGTRAANPADVAVVTTLAAEARRGLADQRGGAVLLATDPRRPDPSPDLEAAVGDPERHLAVGLLDEVVVGYVLVSTLGLGTGQLLGRIDELYVEAGAREVGVGSALVEAALTWADEVGCEGVDAIALPGDRSTKNLFESHGLVARAIVAHRSLRAEEAVTS